MQSKRCSEIWYLFWPLTALAAFPLPDKPLIENIITERTESLFLVSYDGVGYKNLQKSPTFHSCMLKMCLFHFDINFSSEQTCTCGPQHFKHFFLKKGRQFHTSSPLAGLFHHRKYPFLPIYLVCTSHLYATLASLPHLCLLG